MDDEVKEAMLEWLQKMADGIRSGDVLVTTINEQRGQPMYMCSDQDNIWEKTYTFTYHTLPKKTYKSQQEIYEELVQKVLNQAKQIPAFVTKRNEHLRWANIHAVENTLRVWREQYA